MGKLTDQQIASAFRVRLMVEPRGAMPYDLPILSRERTNAGAKFLTTKATRSLPIRGMNLLDYDDNHLAGCSMNALVTEGMQIAFYWDED